MFNLFFTLSAVLFGLAASAPTDSADPVPAIISGPHGHPGNIIPVRPLPAIIATDPVRPISAVLEAPTTEELDQLHDVFVGLTDKVASFAEKFITEVQTGIDDLLKSGKLEKLNQEIGDGLKVGISEAKEGLQILGKAINDHLQKLAESAMNILLRQEQTLLKYKRIELLIEEIIQLISI